MFQAVSVWLLWIQTRVPRQTSPHAYPSVPPVSRLVVRDL